MRIGYKYNAAYKFNRRLSIETKGETFFWNSMQSGSGHEFLIQGAWPMHMKRLFCEVNWNTCQFWNWDWSWAPSVAKFTFNNSTDIDVVILYVLAMCHVCVYRWAELIEKVYRRYKMYSSRLELELDECLDFYLDKLKLLPFSLAPFVHSNIFIHSNYFFRLPAPPPSPWQLAPWPPKPSNYPPSSRKKSPPPPVLRTPPPNTPKLVPLFP